MKLSLLSIPMLFVLTGCMGGYTFSKCANRATDLAGLEGRYTVADLGASVDVVRTGTGTYNMVSEGQVMTGLTTCVVNGNELAEANSENINVALLRKDATLTVTTFDTAVLDAAGIKYETAVIEELGGVSIVAVDGEMADDVFTSALVLGDVSLLKQ